MSKTSKFKETKKEVKIVFEDEEPKKVKKLVQNKFTLKNIDKVEVDRKYVPKELLFSTWLSDEEDVEYTYIQSRKT